MKDDEQFEQLMLQYNQLKNGAEYIQKMLESEDFDGVITMLKSREAVFRNCQCMRRYLDLTPEQLTLADSLFEEIRELELRNMEYLKNDMEKVKTELKRTQQLEKIHQAYEFSEDDKGSIINIQE